MIGKELVGHKVNQVRMDATYLIFETDSDPIGFTVEGDCCSQSFFYDFTGLDKLRGRVVISVSDIDENTRLTEPTQAEYEAADSLSVYGYEFVTEHEIFGPVTSVVSFRNDSNGYYGGWMESISVDTAKRLVDNNEVPVLEGDHGEIKDA